MLVAFSLSHINLIASDCRRPLFIIINHKISGQQYSSCGVIYRYPASRPSKVESTAVGSSMALDTTGELEECR